MNITHRRNSEKLSDYVMLFAETDSDGFDRNTSYGNHRWELKSELPEVDETVIEFAIEFFGMEREEAEELCNPADIIDTAGVWDSPEFVMEFCNANPNAIGYRTQDGAVVLNRDEVELEYTYDPEEEF